MLKVQDKPLTCNEDTTKVVTQNVVGCTSLSAGINLCGHSADSYESWCKAKDQEAPQHDVSTSVAKP